jgi:cytochrome c biogenesis protein ResB
MKIFFDGLLKVLSSSKLALVLVLLVILLSLAGAVLPQEGMFKPTDMARWQEAHPLVTSLLKPLGLFRAFHSVPFLITILLLAVNTLTCTVLYFFTKGGISALRGPGATRLAGFIALHISLILLFAGGFWSAAARLDGFIVLTENQVFKEEHANYVRLVEGPLRKEYHQGFSLRLKSVRVDFRENYLLNIESDIEIIDKQGSVVKDTVKVNHPFTYNHLTFTQDQTGFSPRLLIRDKGSGRVLVNAFAALKTFRKGQTREYRDFLPLPFFKQRVIVTLYPNHKRTGNPALLVETENESGQPIPKGHVTMGSSMPLGKYTIGFIGLRRWSSFKVVEDPGYNLVWIALWLGVAALILRYIPDLKEWFNAFGDQGALLKNRPLDPRKTSD